MSDEFPAYFDSLSRAWELQEAGAFDQAELIYHDVLRAIPDEPNALNHLGMLRQRQGRLGEALDLMRRSVEVAPDIGPLFINLGQLLVTTGDFAGAEAAYLCAISLCDLPLAKNNLGTLLCQTGRLEESETLLRATLQQAPDFAVGWCNFGNLLIELARHEEARDAFRRAVTLAPNLLKAHRGILFSMLLDEAFRPKELLDAHREWNERNAAIFGKQVAPHQNDRSPERRIKVGYVCSDFRDHVLGWNLLPMFLARNKSQCEIFGYSNVAAPDALTEQFRLQFDHWRDIAAINDDQAAQLVRADAIDVLVDLNLHSTEDRMLLFARKPAPVQITFGGYPGTTGLGTIDYRLSDPFLDPPGQHDDEYTERTIRLPQTFWCFDPNVMGVKDLPLSPLPASANGYVTFGCLNSYFKVRDAMLNLWARVLCAVQSSRLLMLAPEGEPRTRIQTLMESHGVDARRVEFVPRLLRKQYLQTYERIDIALDTLPYNGHTSGLEALWQGVPVVTRVGPTVVGRAGVSQLSILGLQDDLVAWSDDEFVAKATSLAGHLPRLASLRSSLRDRILASRLADKRGFAQGIDDAIRSAWRAWCRGNQND